MPTAVDIGDALDLTNLPDIPGFKVLKVTVRDYENWDHEAALRVDVLIDDSVDPEQEGFGKKVGDFKRAIHDNLLKNGVTLFPYIFLASPSELAETVED